MIQPNELRLGNRVNYKNNHYQIKGVDLIDNSNEIGVDDVCLVRLQVNKDLNYQQGEWVSLDLITLIPLTEEILLKCGFEFSNHFKAYTHNELYIEIKQNDGKGYWKLDPIDGKCDNELYLTAEAEYTVSDVPIKYLHQLQNLYFALTNKELEIEL